MSDLLIPTALTLDAEETAFKRWHEGDPPLVIFVDELSVAEHWLLLNLNSALPGADAARNEALNGVARGFTPAQQLALAMEGIGSFVERNIAAWKPGRDPETGARQFDLFPGRFQIGSIMKDASEIRSIRNVLTEIGK
jgi:hypothetical protein